MMIKMLETNFIDTKIGCVPKDWTEVALGEIDEVRMCKRVMKYQTSEKGDVPFFKIGTFGKILMLIYLVSFTFNMRRNIIIQRKEISYYPLQEQ